MYRSAEQIVYSPTDLCVFFESPFASWMDRYHLERPGELTPDEQSETMKLLSALGDAHERAIVERYRSEGRRVVQIERSRDRPFSAAFEETIDAMRGGAEVIYQAALRLPPFQGWADFLVRVDAPCPVLGAYSYEIADTKLAKSAKPYFLLQLSAYAEMLEVIQGRRPAHVQVITGAKEVLTFRTDDFFHYYRSLKSQLLRAQAVFDPERRPIPDARADHGRWQSHAAEILRAIDHPSRVAGINRSQMRRLAQAGITTTRALATTSLDRVPRMDEAALSRLKAQARLQIASEGRDRPLFELLPHEPGTRRGLALLPPPSTHDVFFDMEGYPLVEGGLEYLFGASYTEAGALRYRDFWAHDRAAEKRAFEAFIDWLTDRFERDPSMHVYHYGVYEVAALRRLMGAHATREEQLDRLLRAEVFIDLYRVVRQSLRVGEPSYSLKTIEKLYRGARNEQVQTAGDSVIAYARWREGTEGDTYERSPILSGIRDYNRADCESTAELTSWLRERQHEASVEWVRPIEKVDSAGAPMSLRPPREDEALTERMLALLPVDRSSDPERWRLHELLAYLVTFHRREDKPLWWAHFDRLAMTREELTEDHDCLGGLVRTSTAAHAEKQSLEYEYRFDPDQDTKLAQGDKCYLHDGSRATIARIDRNLGLVSIRRSKKIDAPPDQTALIPDERVNPDPIAASIRRTASRWLETGELPRALGDLLRRSAPRLRDRSFADAWRKARAKAPDLASAVVAVIAELNESTIGIQGPPGSGKSYTASRAIVHLLGQGKRVAISSNSHKAIEKLMGLAIDHACDRGVAVRAVKVGGEDCGVLSAMVRHIGKMEGVVHEGALRDQLVGGTAWALCDAPAGSFDYLFVDEAGQVSLANMIGMAPAARNLVLLGDQMQLGQPVKGAHPGDSGTSALEYLLEKRATIPDHLGVFLEETRRLHPAICSFISGAVYEDRLTATRETAGRTIRVPDHARLVREEAGIVFVPVDHEGNTRASEEEVQAIRELMSELLGRQLVLPNGKTRVLAESDVLIVAPYNMQVRALSQALPTARVGTVDKFQGQEAPVVIVSMCASSAEGSARGMEFLFNRNRLNVAISRAQCLAIIVGSPALPHAHAKSVKQMRLANLFCRAVG
jgi:predicted RecB family nuclease